MISIASTIKCPEYINYRAMARYQLPLLSNIIIFLFHPSSLPSHSQPRSFHHHNPHNYQTSHHILQIQYFLFLAIFNNLVKLGSLGLAGGDGQLPCCCCFGRCPSWSSSFCRHLLFKDLWFSLDSKHIHRHAYLSVKLLNVKGNYVLYYCCACGAVYTRKISKKLLYSSRSRMNVLLPLPWRV